MADKPTLSREYVFIPFTEMNMDVGDLTVNAIAFIATAGDEPEESDWEPAIVVDSAHDLFATFGAEGLAILQGPERGDTVTTIDLADGTYQVWIDARVTGSDERIVRLAGVLNLTPTGA